MGYIVEKGYIGTSIGWWGVRVKAGAKTDPWNHTHSISPIHFYLYLAYRRLFTPTTLLCFYPLHLHLNPKPLGTSRLLNRISLLQPAKVGYTYVRIQRQGFTEGVGVQILRIFPPFRFLSLTQSLSIPSFFFYFNTYTLFFSFTSSQNTLGANKGSTR